ncbi:hypothetical protein TUBRATIS_008930 [Tubulinosema ratisbonensis]|uniref:Uncharacterized protein n=1 Tax=Tubulinosema ratisbonensis TaxID=291195 RepID=A0A437ANJ5_9MICR|nr:hypothetical protein TUBRATIS_008930 [Tubulinosema ratisbonensis]
MFFYVFLYFNILIFFSKNEHEKFVNVYKILACLLQTKYKIYFLNKFLNCQKNKFINEQRNLQHEIESTSLLATKNSFTTKSNELVEDNVFVFHSFLTNQKLELSLVKESISDPLFLYLCKPISDPSFIIKNKQNIYKRRSNRSKIRLIRIIKRLKYQNSVICFTFFQLRI